METGLIFIFMVNLVIWLGIAIYLFQMDRKISKLERKVETKLDEN